MKIQEAIDRTDTLKPNSFEQSDKLFWLSNLDKTIFKTVIMTHEGAAVTEFNGYDANTNTYSTDLLVDDTFADLYVDYLSAHIDYYNGEINSYNNNATKYGERYKEYTAWYNRTHMPIQGAREVYF